MGSVCLFKLEFSPFLDIQPDVELLDRTATLLFNFFFCKTSILFSVACARFTFSPTVKEGSFFWDKVFIQQSLNKAMKEHHSSRLGILKTTKKGFSLSLLPLGQGAFLGEGVQLETNLLLSKDAGAVSCCSIPGSSVWMGLQGRCPNFISGDGSSGHTVLVVWQCHLPGRTGQEEAPTGSLAQL